VFELAAIMGRPMLMIPTPSSGRARPSGGRGRPTFAAGSWGYLLPGAMRGAATAVFSGLVLGRG
jgi:hypothetical protein